MARITKKFRKSKLLSAILIVMLTASYLLVTSAYAQEATHKSSFTPSGAELTYKRDALSYGDLWAFDAATYDASCYGGPDSPPPSWTYYSNSDNTKGDATKGSSDNYYGTISISGRTDPVSGTKVEILPHAAFVNSTASTITGQYGQSIPVRTTTGKGIYTIIPHAVSRTDNSGDDYRVYVHSETDPSNAVSYYLIDSYADNNNYASDYNAKTTANAQPLTFTGVGNGWWYAELDVPYIGWEAGYPHNAQDSGSSNKGDSFPDAYTSAQLTNTTLGDTYYYNTWSINKVKYNTLLVLQWSADVQLGPITKEDSITITPDANTGDAYTGSLNVTNIFGETITANGQAQTAVHAPLFIEPQAADDLSMFDGFAGTTLEQVVDGVFQYTYEASGSITGQWAMVDALPTVTVSGNGYTGTSNFYSMPELKTSYITEQQTTYTITPDYTAAPGTSISYVISEAGKEDRTGTLTEALTLTAVMDDITVVMTATSASGETERTCVLTISVTPDATLSYVAQNQTTGTKYHYIEDAIVEANSGDTIVVLRNASFRSPEQNRKGSWTQNNAGYTIDPGVTLLIPYSDSDYGIQDGSKQENNFIHANAAYTTCGNIAVTSMVPSQSKFRELTIPIGITVSIGNGTANTKGNYGRIVIGGTIVGSEGSNSYEGATYGNHANLVVNGNLQIGSYGVLSVAGYVYGGGSITTTDTNACIYQPMVILDWRGAGVAPLFVDSSLSQKVDIQSDENQIAPFMDWGTFNIQSKITINSGNYMYLYASLREGDAYCSVPLLIGDSRAPGFINLSSGAKLESKYEPIGWSSDKRDFPGRNIVTITKGAELGALQMNIAVAGNGMEIDTANYSFPVSYCYNITLDQGDYYIDKSMILLPGASITVNDDAFLYLGTKATSTVRIVILDGLLHRVKQGNAGFGKTIEHRIAYEAKRYDAKNYPATAELQAVGLSGDAELTVAGTLVLGANASLGGVIQTQTAGATVNATAGTAGTKSTAVFQIGVVGSGNVMLLNRYCAGMVLYERTAQLRAYDGTTIDIIRGKTYTGGAAENIQENYSFRYYPYANDVKEVNLVGNATAGANETVTATHPAYTLNETIRGKWICDSHEFVADENDPNHTLCKYCRWSCEEHSYTYTSDGEGTNTATGTCSICGSNTSVPVSVNFEAIQLSVEAEVMLRLKITVAEGFNGTIKLTEAANERTLVDDVTVYTVTESGLIDQNGNAAETETTAQGVTRYVLDQGIAAGEMTGIVSIEAFDASGNPCCIRDYIDGSLTQKLERTVLDYAKLALEKGGDEMKELARTMLTFGGYAQAFYKVDIENPAYNILPEYGFEQPDINAVTLAFLNEIVEGKVRVPDLSWAPVSSTLMMSPPQETEPEATEPETTEVTEPTEPEITEPEEPEVVETSEATEPTVTETTGVTEPDIPETTQATEPEVPETTIAAETEETIEVTEQHSVPDMILTDSSRTVANVFNSGKTTEENAVFMSKNFMLDMMADKHTTPAEEAPTEAQPELDETKQPEEVLVEEVILSAAEPMNEAATLSEEDFGIAYANAQVINFDARVDLTSYFTLYEGASISDYTFTLTYAKGGKPFTRDISAEVKQESNGNRYAVKIADIPVAYWDFEYVITVTQKDSGASYELRSSILAWAKRCITSYETKVATLSDEELAQVNTAQVNMAKAMYYYNQAANDYFDR